MKKLLAVAMTLIILSPVMAQQTEPYKQPRTINVNGSSQLEITPDEIYVQITLREYDKKNGEKVSIENIKNNFLNGAKNIGLHDTDITVQSYHGWDGTWWWYKKNKKQDPDLKANIAYQVKLSSVKQIDALVSKLDDDATENFNITKTSHSQLEKLKKQLKIEAVKDALHKAQYLAEAINENVGEAITINEPNEMHFPQPYYSMARTEMKQEDAVQSEPPMNVDFQKIKLEYQVNVVFSLK